MQALADPAAASEEAGSEGEGRAAASVVAVLEEAGAAGKDVLPYGPPPISITARTEVQRVPTLSTGWHRMA
jgi:hypothetical protein